MNCQVQSMWLVEPLFCWDLDFDRILSFSFFVRKLFWDDDHLHCASEERKAEKLGRCDPNCGKPYESNKITH